MRLKYQGRWRIFAASLTRCHESPPSSERNSPPSLFSTIAQRRLVLTGETVTLILPSTPAGRPRFRVISVHVSPPSIDLKRPEPSPPESIRHGLRPICQNAA